MKRAFLLVGLTLIVAACSDDTQPTGDTRPGDGKPSGGDHQLPGDGGARDGFTPADCSGCGAGKGCIVVTVTRAADESMQPWKVWPTEADAVGTLVVGAMQGTTAVSRKTVANADFKAATAKYVVELGCVPSGTLKVSAFLDENLNASASAVTSADYRDSCPASPRQRDVVVTDLQTAPVAIELANSCD
jgi:hypothetical protein